MSLRVEKTYPSPKGGDTIAVKGAILHLPQKSVGIVGKQWAEWL